MAVKLLSVSELKAQAGKILDRALAGQPQYVVRSGEVVQIAKTGLLVGIEDRPPGYFADDYAGSALPETDSGVRQNAAWFLQRLALPGQSERSR